MNPKISVIVPVYKAEKYLHRCVDSILAQTFTDFEVLLIDDGSPDRSGEICDEYAKKDERICVFHKDNQGAGLARKCGVEKAHGDWFVFVDSDDTIPKDALENLVNDSNDGNYDLVIGTFTNDKGYTYKHHITGIIDRDEYIKALLSDTTMIGPVVKLYKKSIFNRCCWNIDRRIIQNEDLLMLLDYAIHVDKVFISNDNICYIQYVREDSVSQSAKMSSEGWFLLFDRMEEILDSYSQDNSNLKIILNKYKLRRIYVRIFGNILKLDTSKDTIKKLLSEEDTYKDYLNETEQKTLILLKSKFRRNVHYFRLKTIANIKMIAEKLGLLQVYYKIRYKI